MLTQCAVVTILLTSLVPSAEAVIVLCSHKSKCSVSIENCSFHLAQLTVDIKIQCMVKYQSLATFDNLYKLKKVSKGNSSLMGQ